MKGAIANTYAVGKVKGTEAIGGLVGYKEIGTIEASYYDRETTGQNDFDQGTPLLTMKMQQQGSYQSWDFVPVWSIDEGSSYPYLKTVTPKDSSAPIGNG